MENPSSSPNKSKWQYAHYLLYLLPILAILLGYAAITVATGESYPFTIVLGPSMQPTILPGSVAMISHVPFSQLKVGDVIVFRPQISLLFTCDSGPTNSLISETSVPCYVIHRIAKIGVDSHGNEILTTKGDNNPGSIPGIDTGINSSMYVGAVILQLPVAGYLTVAPTNEIVAAVILAGLFGEIFYERAQNRKRQGQLQGDQSTTAVEPEIKEDGAVGDQSQSRETTSGK